MTGKAPPSNISRNITQIMLLNIWNELIRNHTVRMLTISTSSSPYDLDKLELNGNHPYALALVKK